MNSTGKKHQPPQTLIRGIKMKDKDDCNMVGQQGMITKAININGYKSLPEVGVVMRVAEVKTILLGGMSLESVGHRR